jgi:predicted ATPase
MTKTDFNEELRFVSADNSVNIEVEKVATGFKTFIYLQRLLENGCLGDDCLLLIDEPEAHLHPQWIVEYARLLVLLNKELGQKIMLATHNPDMVAAIRSIAEKEKVLDKTNFYIAEPSEQPNTYCYKALGTDISEIFTSFNIALDRIQAYGTDSL